jgi:uncharacterized SAM-binding protein YcdF (DUF218 family)
MFPLISKLLTPLVAPLGIAFMLWLAALCAQLLRPRWRQPLLLAGIAVVLFFSSYGVGGWLMGRLESEYPALTAEESPQADVIIVLGGTTVPALPPRAHIEVGAGYDRLLHGLRLYRAGKAPYLLFSGGTIEVLTGTTESEAKQYLALAQEAGITAEHIVLEERSRNTYENALYAQQTMAARGWENALLVTSASHMPRAMAVFNALGIEVVAAPTDVRIVSSSHSLSFFDVLPTAFSLELSSPAAKEYVGWWVYWLRGWIHEP